MANPVMEFGPDGFRLVIGESASDVADYGDFVELGSFLAWADLDDSEQVSYWVRKAEPPLDNVEERDVEEFPDDEDEGEEEEDDEVVVEE